MARYKKKSIVIEAVQWDGSDESLLEIHKMTRHIHPQAQAPIVRSATDVLIIHILLSSHGTMTAIVGDWIIKSVRGQFYPCKPDVFEATYEKA